MAAVTPAAEQAKDLLQKLTIDPKNKTQNATDAAKKNSGAAATNNAIPPYDKSLTPLLQEYSDGSRGYLPNGYPSTYYYGGYDGTLGEWGEDYPRYVNPEGVEISPGFYGDMYHHGYVYAPYGWNKLDAAYQEANEKTVRCPVFLSFSVNTSGQFVGVAEMTGSVDFNKTVVEYWQQDKWTGCFPVKWHIVKDVPNSILKHITLENNDNKPVTNSRDTQEVKLEQGLQVLKLFKEHTSRTSILDDFNFYETRQKVMQEKRLKQQHFQKKILDVKHVDVDEKDKDGASGKSGSQMPLEVATVVNDPVHGGLGELVVAEEKNGVVAVAEKRVLANGVAC